MCAILAVAHGAGITFHCFPGCLRRKTLDFSYGMVLRICVKLADKVGCECVDSLSCYEFKHLVPRLLLLLRIRHGCGMEETQAPCQGRFLFRHRQCHVTPKGMADDDGTGIISFTDK